MLSSLIYRVKNRESRFFDLLYVIARSVINFSFPCSRHFHKMLWWERKGRHALWGWLLRVFYYTPLFKSLCVKAGKNLRLIEGLPFTNENLTIRVGDNVRIYGSAGFNGYKVFEKPLLEIGDDTFIGPDVRIGVGKEIRIGSHCLIAARVFIADHDGHSLDWKERRANRALDKEDIRPVIIQDDAWLGEGVFVCKGVTIGRGAVVAARSVVTKDVPPFAVVAGNPAKAIKKS